MLFAIFLRKSDLWEKSSSWDMGQNCLGQSDCRIFQSVSLERNDELDWFLHVDKSSWKLNCWLKNIGVGVMKNGCHHSGTRMLKLVVSQERINGLKFAGSQRGTRKLAMEGTLSSIFFIKTPRYNCCFVSLTKFISSFVDSIKFELGKKEVVF